VKNKEFIIRFKSGNWQKVICKDIKITTDISGNKLETIDFIKSESEENAIPVFLNINEVISIFPVVKKNKKNKENTTYIIDIIDDEEIK